jgi:ubiquitin carboxyl-terminal hydrolase 9/24
VIETTQLMVSLKMIKSPYLEKRLTGLQQIRTFIDKLNREIFNYQTQQRLRPPKFISKEFLRTWIIDNNVIDILLSPNSTHSELVKRVPSVLKFLLQEGLPEEMIRKLWTCQVGKHEEMVRVVFDVIRDISQFMQPEHLQK